MSKVISISNSSQTPSAASPLERRIARLEIQLKALELKCQKLEHIQGLMTDSVDEAIAILQSIRGPDR